MPSKTTKKRKSAHAKETEIDRKAEALANLEKIVAAEDSLSLREIAALEHGDKLSTENKSAGHRKKLKASEHRRENKKSFWFFVWRLSVPLMIFGLVVFLMAESAGVFGGAGQEIASKMLSSVGSFFTNTNDGQLSAPVQSVVPTSTIPSIVSVDLLLALDKEDDTALVPTIKVRSVETDVTTKDSFPTTGQQQASDARATGTITVTNETTRGFNFIVTTRFLSETGMLFRLKNPAAIPAKASVEVIVYADKIGATGDVGPSKFTIPGLSTDLQHQVYGESKSAMIGGDGKMIVVSKDDLDAANKELHSRLSKDARDNFKAMISADEVLLDDLMTSKDLTVELPKEGTAGATFTANIAARFNALLVPENKITPLLQQKLVSVLPDGEQVANYQLGDLLYTVEAYDTTNGRAEIKVEAPVTKI